MVTSSAEILRRSPGGIHLDSERSVVEKDPDPIGQRRGPARVDVGLSVAAGAARLACALNADALMASIGHRLTGRCGSVVVSSASVATCTCSCGALPVRSRAVGAGRLAGAQR